MTFARPDHATDFDTLPRIPSWVISARAETLEDIAFLSGAVLTHLHLVLGREEVPKALLRDRLALRAAEACVARTDAVVPQGWARTYRRSDLVL